MCPRPPRSITACDGTSASALNRNHQSSLMCKRKLGKEEEAPQRVAKQLLLQSWWVMMCLCCSAGIKAEVLSVEVAAAAACDWGCQPWTPQISTRWHRGDMAEPKSQTCSLLNLAACTVWKQFSCWMNDSSSKNMWLSKEVEEGKKKCFVRFIMLIKPRKPHSSVRIWLPNDCVTHFWECFVRKGRYGAKEGKRLSKAAKMWQNQEICEKGRNQAVRRYLGHAVFFVFLFFLKTAYTICSLSATLDVQLLLFSRVTQLQWNYAATPYAEHAIILPKQQSDHSASLTSRLANPMVFVVFSWIL